MTILGHADRIVSSLSPQVRSAFIGAPKSAVELLGLTARPVPRLQERRGDGGWCDGLSFLDDGIILYAETPNSRRENFTLAHEAAHWLVDHDDDAADWVADHESPEVTLEQLCDHIAGRLLVPTEILSSVVGNGPPRAKHLQELYVATNASEPACAIALTRHLGGFGAAVLLDLNTRIVKYASIVWDGFDGRPVAYPWSKQDAPQGHFLRAMKANEQRTVKSWWATPWGERQAFYVDAITSSKVMFAVFSAHDLWEIERLHIEVAERQLDRPTQELACQCGFTGKISGFPCPTCGVLFCPKCKSCGCQRLFSRHKPCSRCFTSSPTHTLKEGLCVECQ
ncbi:ImmA/IrrE family metallo-endopeptidase [Amycolatopsis sp. NBC_00438]|uniref:ImmA/IrrE family metallo-endopeptidase n=1 Tax=Amycolatopsis sp. NBC_00438 TaxID=2903558 RepID=UPI002E2035C6